MNKFFNNEIEKLESDKAKKVVDCLNAVNCNITEFTKINKISRTYTNYLIKKYNIKRKTIAYIE